MTPDSPKCPDNFPWTPRLLAIPHALARTFARGNPELIEDLTGHGYVALVRAAATYDPAKGAAIETHLYGCVRWQMFSYFDPRRKKSKYVPPPTLSLDQPCDNGGSGVLPPLGRLLEAREESDDAEFLREQTDALLGRLDARDAKTLRLLYMDGLKLRQAAVILGVSKERVRQIRNRALAVLRGDLPQSVPRRGTAVGTAILAWLASRKRPISSSAIKKHFGEWSPDTVRNAIRHLAQAKMLRRVGKAPNPRGCGAPLTLYLPTAAGRRAGVDARENFGDS